MPLKRMLFTMLFMAVLAAEGVSAQATGTPTFFAPTRGFGNAEAGVSVRDGISANGGYPRALFWEDEWIHSPRIRTSLADPVAHRKDPEDR